MNPELEAIFQSLEAAMCAGEAATEKEQTAEYAEHAEVSHREAVLNISRGSSRETPGKTRHIQSHRVAVAEPNHRSEADLEGRRKNDPGKLAIAARLRKETILSIKGIAARVRLGTSKSANVNLHSWMRASGKQWCEAKVSTSEKMGQ